MRENRKKRINQLAIKIQITDISKNRLIISATETNNKW